LALSHILSQLLKEEEAENTNLLQNRSRADGRLSELLEKDFSISTAYRPGSARVGLSFSRTKRFAVKTLDPTY